jgi:AAA domain
MHPRCVDLIMATIGEAEAEFRASVGYIVIDTFAKGIAAGGGDEDKAKDQNKCLTNLRRLHERANLHVAIVGHTGKDETRGSRGSNAHPADVDLQVQITGDEIKIARVIKGNDQPEGDLTSFKLESAELGIDEDGDPVTTAILSDEAIAVAATETKLSKNQQTMFSLLHTAGPSGLTIDEWNQKAREVGLGTKRNADLYDYRMALKGKGVIRQYGERWTVTA